MTVIICGSEECVWNKRSECQRCSISVDDEAACEMFEDYTDSADYNKKYYAQVGLKEEDGVPEGRYKEARYGKRDKVAGLVVYYEGDDREGKDYISCTEETTGHRLPYNALLDDALLEKVRKAMSEAEPVAGLPEVERYGHGKYRLAQEAT